MELLDGKKTAAEIRGELKKEVEALKAAGQPVPGLVTILVGENPASEIYVRSKVKDCEEVGFRSESQHLPSDISQDELVDIIESYNKSDDFHGILVQLPLPKHIDEKTIIETIDPAKDVDGFHPMSVGYLVIGEDTFYPCTPAGIQEMFRRYKIETKGKHVVVVGRSNIVGKPAANIMLQKKDFANSIVTVCHSAAGDLSRYTKQADILIAAIGRAEFITAEMVKEGAVVVDVGINRVDDPSRKKGYRVVGDVAFDEVAEKASYITPVPGGVGLMTRAMLLTNTFKAYNKLKA